MHPLPTKLSFALTVTPPANTGAYCSADLAQMSAPVVTVGTKYKTSLPSTVCASSRTNSQWQALTAALTLAQLSAPMLTGGIK